MGKLLRGGGGVSTSVCHVLSGSGPGSPTFGVGELSFFRGNVQEAGGGTCGVPKEDNRTEGDATEGQDLAAGGIIEVS